jgi:hypothetical protein
MNSPPDQPPENSGQKQDTRFKPGRSGNPLGKPPGARNKVYRAVEALLDGEAEALTRKAVDLALNGDTIALRLCLDRIAPPRKSRAVTLDLPELRSAADVLAGMTALIQAMANGEISPDEAQQVAGILEGVRRVIETNEFEQRIAALEGPR